jgi:hypothetical protein
MGGFPGKGGHALAGSAARLARHHSAGITRCSVLRVRGSTRAEIAFAARGNLANKRCEKEPIGVVGARAITFDTPRGRLDEGSP